MASLKAFFTRTGSLLIPLVILTLSVGLRIPNLGYSDYHGDELKAVMVPKRHEALFDFLLNQRKGPMQFLVSYIPYSITRDYKNELAQRLPFALASCFSSVLFYLFVKNLTSDMHASFSASTLFLTNGFLVGFGRIAQYQNLNLLFSFASLFLYSKLKTDDLKNKNVYIYSIGGTTFWMLSFLSHWDATFILPIVVFLTYKTFATNKKVLLVNLLIALILLMPFTIPYLARLSENNRNQVYLTSRVGLDLGYSKVPLYKALFEVYNPYLVLPFLLITAIFSLLQIKKFYPIVIWFLFVFIIFEIGFKNPGTHIYNFLLPLFILSGIGISHIIKIHRFFKHALYPTLLYCLSYIYYQTYILYVDNQIEYPYEAKSIKFLNISLEAPAIKNIKPEYMRGSYIPLFGFPHARDWNEINNFINHQNQINKEDLKFITNEDKAFCDGYMDAEYGTGEVYYAIGIKRPTNFVMDYGFSNIGSKRLIKTFKHGDETVVKIYRVQSRKTT